MSFRVHQGRHLHQRREGPGIRLGCVLRLRPVLRCLPFRCHNHAQVPGFGPGEDGGAWDSRGSGRDHGSSVPSEELQAFTGEPVSDGEFELLFEAARLSPTAQNAMDVEFVVIDERLDGFRRMLADVLEPLSGEYPRIAQYVEHVRTGEGPDPFMWEGRQVILAFSGDSANACIAMSRVEIMAQAMGLGGFYSMWIRMADDADHRELMSFIGCVDPGKRLGCAFVIGHPRIRYRRMAPRPEPTVHRL